MRLILSLQRTAYSLLYHQLAWTYDWVAAVVSLGHWKDWERCALPYLNGRVLEIGFGPGHLQVAMQAQGLSVFGVDESRQMAHLARHRLMKIGIYLAISRGYAQSLPFKDQTFQCVAATFPTEYIFEARTLQEIQRVLWPGGKLVIVPMAWISGGGRLERFMAWLLWLVGETPGKPGPLPDVARQRLNQAGFSMDSELVEMEGSHVLVVVGTKG